MDKKVVCLALGLAVAAAGGIYLGWKVPAAPLSATATLFSMQSAPPTTLAEREMPAPGLLAQSDQAAPAERPQGRMEPTRGEASASTDRPLFLLDTPSTKMVVDPKNGKASLETPLGSVSMDTGKREARLDSGPLYLGIGW